MARGQGSLTARYGGKAQLPALPALELPGRIARICRRRCAAPDEQGQKAPDAMNQARTQTRRIGRSITHYKRQLPALLSQRLLYGATNLDRFDETAFRLFPLGENRRIV